MEPSRPDDPTARRPVEPDDLTGASFRVALRGYDQLEVKALLNRAAERLRTLSSELDHVRGRLDEAEHRAVDLASMDDETLTKVLGEETARVLQGARSAAADIRATAEARAAEAVRAAEQEAAALRTEAQGLVEREQATADARATEIVERAKAAGRHELEAARHEGRQLIEQATRLRDEILGDLSRRRLEAEAQLEHLEATRRALVTAFEGVAGAAQAAIAELAQVGPGTAGAPEAAADVEPADWEAELLRLGELLAARPPEPAPPPPPAPAPSALSPPDPSGASAGAPPTAAGAEPAAPEPEPTVKVVTFDDTAGSSAPPGTGHSGRGRAAGPPGGAVEAASPPAAADEAIEEPEAPPEVEGRRSSALRIIRAESPTPTPKPKPAPPPRPRPETAPPSAPVADEVPLEVVSEGADFEGVRVLPAEKAPAPGPDPGGKAPVAAAPSPTTAAGSDDGGGDAPTDEEADVEALFARIRADREAATEWAREVLSPPGANGGGERPAGVKGGERATAAEATDPAAASAPTRPAPFARRDEAVEHHAPALAKALRRVMADEQNDVLAAVRGHRGWPSVGDILPGIGEQGERYVSAATGVLSEVAGLGAAAVGGRLPAAGAAQAAAVAEAVCTPLRQRLDRTLSEARADLSEGGSRVDDMELADRVSAVYREWRRRRLDDIAVAQVRGAFGAGAYGALPAGSGVAWVCDPAHGPCSPDCEDNALGGPVEKGTAMPSGAVWAPAFDGCRCLVLPSPS